MTQATLPSALQQTPDLDRWLRIEDDGTITIFTGKVEIGQGIRTTVAQIVAEELDVAVERLRVVLADTGRTPDEGYTAGSNSTQGSGGALRQVAAEVRHILLTMAAERLGAAVDRLRVADGLVVDPVPVPPLVLNTRPSRTPSFPSQALRTPSITACFWVLESASRVTGCPLLPRGANGFSCVLNQSVPSAA